MRRVILTLLGLIALSLLIFYAAVIEAPRIERNIQAEAVQRLNNAGIAGVSVQADGRRIMATGQTGVQSNALQLLRQQAGVQQAEWVNTGLGVKASRSTGIHAVREPTVTPDPSGTSSEGSDGSGEAVDSTAGAGDDATLADGEQRDAPDVDTDIASNSGSAARDLSAIDGAAGTWATGIRLSKAGLAISGDSIDDDAMMQATLGRLRELAGDAPVNVSAKSHDALPESWPAAVVAGATALSEMGEGSAVLSNGQIKITGTVLDKAQEKTIRRALVQLVPADLTWRTEFSYLNDGGPVEGLSAFACNAQLAEHMSGKRIVFERGSSSLSFDSFDVLDGVARVLAQCPAVRVEVAGFTDSRGSLQLNNRISQDRADTVRLYLAEHGVAGSRLMATGYGPQRPVATNDTAEGRALNRRIEFNVFGE